MQSDGPRGLPVARLLGGYRDRLRVYRTCVFPGKPDQSDVPYETQAEYAVRLKQTGYTAMKVRAWRPTPMDDVEMLAVARSAVGDEFEIMFDRTAVRPGWVWDYDTALQVARGMERYNARWLEEPFDGHDLEGPARLAAEVDIPITGGELGKSIHQFLAFLTHKTYDVLQPDTRICGGILNARKISILAEAFHVPCIQHGTGGLSLAGYIQAGCAMPNCEYQEIIGQPNLPQEQWEPALRILRTPHVFEIEDGYVKLPDLAGAGPRRRRGCARGVQGPGLTDRSLDGIDPGPALIRADDGERIRRCRSWTRSPRTGGRDRSRSWGRRVSCRPC